MKKKFGQAILATLAIICSAGFISCAESEETAEVNPGYNPVTGEVPVDFVLSLSTGNTPATRQSAANTQATVDEKFRGMESTYLMSFQQEGKDGKHMYGVTSSTEADKLYSLGTIITTQDIDPSQKVSGAQKSNRVLELSLPINTNTVMFWGKAAKTGKDDEQGKIDFKVSKKLEESSFKLCPRVPEDDDSNYGTKAFKQYQALLAAILNKIIKVEANYNVQSNSGSTVTGTMKWADYVKESGDGKKWEQKTYDPTDEENKKVSMCALGEKLAKAFVDLNNFTVDKGGNAELRAGSGQSVAYMLSDLYGVINPIKQASPTDFEERVAQCVAEEIIDMIDDFLSGSTWNSLSSVKEKSELAAADYALVKDELGKYPSNFGMPNGSTLLQYDITKNEYSYRETVPTYDMGGTATTTFNIFKYMYPAELCYFGNSSIRVTDDIHVKTDYPDGVSEWDNDNNWKADAEGRNNTHAWTEGHVLSSTRSVAMKNNINYGTALLKSTVRFKDKILKDNNEAIQTIKVGATSTEKDKQIDVSMAGNVFKLKGILIGGQYKEMGWNYVAKKGSDIDCMIYDNKLYDSDGDPVQNLAIPAFPSGEGATTSASTAPVYTLVWDNYTGESTQNIVYVALEFENQTGQDFWGEQNLIRNGETFYITGKLDPKTNTTTIDWPEKYALPPYDSDGATIQAKRVFIQDYMTTANFVIDETSLKKALIALPDLRASQISLGLSVDLEWSTGLEFNDIVLGKTGSE